jgi:hypothetical protein
MFRFKPFLTLFLACVYCAITIAQKDSIAVSIPTPIDSTSDSVKQIVENQIPDSKDSKRIKISEELNFAMYLITNEQYDNASFLLNELSQWNEGVSQIQADSIHYLSGWLKYFSQDFYGAIGDFSKIESSGKIGTPAKFYESICYVHSEEYEAAKRILHELKCDSSSLEFEFRNFQLASIALLERDYNGYDSIIDNYSYKFFQFSSEQKGMELYYNDLVSYKRKSPFVAGFLSALFPGIGKIYAGYRGMPFGTMYLTLPLAAVAIEVALIAGILSPPFLVFGSLFGIFYIGNIWGSAVSVYAIEKELYAEIDHNILFDMHIPLRRIFWQ